MTDSNPTATGTPAGAIARFGNALAAGTRLNEFEITRLIGEGGFSLVYLAFDHTLHRPVAVKEYIPSGLAWRQADNTVVLHSSHHEQTFEAGLRSFINEARLLAQFDHPALVKVYRFWEGNGTAYLAMPFYEGRTLKEILKEQPALANEAWLKELIAPILDALQLLHAHDCFHRDIAPDNIQVLASGAPLLLDFGAARRTIGDMTQAFTVILKPGYAPIEQYADAGDVKQGPWTDVYALAAVLYAAVTGRPPPTSLARIIKDPLQPLSAHSPPGFSVEFLAGIDRGLAVRPEARPQSVREFAQALGITTQTDQASGSVVYESTQANVLRDNPSVDQREAEQAAAPRTGSSRTLEASDDSTVLQPSAKHQRSIAPAAATTQNPLPVSEAARHTEHSRGSTLRWAMALGGALVVVSLVSAVYIGRQPKEDAGSATSAGATSSADDRSGLKPAEPPANANTTPPRTEGMPMPDSTPAIHGEAVAAPASDQRARGGNARVDSDRQQPQNSTAGEHAQPPRRPDVSSTAQDEPQPRPQQAKGRPIKSPVVAVKRQASDSEKRGSATAPSVRPEHQARCQALLERAQLGELSRQDQLFMERECKL
ncbi:MAG: protein kinase [Pseudomonadota bacterium]|nr:protein kinase [Pseudomonadota bacterium]